MRYLNRDNLKEAFGGVSGELPRLTVEEYRDEMEGIL